ncbi:MAG: hypothetical protein GX774_06400 [Armatimonadetes bacterium]|jgi:hypothetical protein|nr:hypothetical protein [Armatimonadota bacterium]
MVTFVVLIVVLALSMVLLAHFLGRAERDAVPPPAAEESTSPEQTGLGEPEWNVVIQKQCLPTNCPNLKGSPPQPGKEPGCQVCASMFLERYGERLLRQQREGRNR